MLSGKAYNAGAEIAESRGEDFTIADAYRYTTTFTSKYDRTGSNDTVFERVLFRDKEGKWDAKDQGVNDLAAITLAGYAAHLGIRKMKGKSERRSQEGDRADLEPK